MCWNYFLIASLHLAITGITEVAAGGYGQQYVEMRPQNEDISRSEEQIKYDTLKPKPIATFTSEGTTADSDERTMNTEEQSTSGDFIMTTPANNVVSWEDGSSYTLEIEPTTSDEKIAAAGGRRKQEGGYEHENKETKPQIRVISDSDEQPKSEIFTEESSGTFAVEDATSYPDRIDEGITSTQEPTGSDEIMSTSLTTLATLDYKTSYDEGLEEFVSSTTENNKFEDITSSESTTSVPLENTQSYTEEPEDQMLHDDITMKSTFITPSKPVNSDSSEILSPSAWDADLDIILDGVTYIWATEEGSFSNMLTVYGDAAFPIVAGVPKPSTASVMAPIAAAARYGEGRIVVFANSVMTHHVYERKNDNEQFFKNCLHWVLGEKTTDKEKKTIGIAERSGELLQFWPKKIVTKLGFTDQRIDWKDKKLKLDSDAYFIWDINMVPNDLLEELKNYMDKGGGILVAGPPSDLDKYNRFLGPVGINWVDPEIRTAHAIYFWEFDAQREFLQNYTHIGVVARKIIRALEFNVSAEFAEFDSLQFAITTALKGIDPSYISWLNDLRRSFDKMENINASVEHPLTPSPFDKFQAGFQKYLYDRVLEPREIFEHPTAAIFPGEVDKQRMREVSTVQKVNILVNHSTLINNTLQTCYGYSTLLYAPAGQEIRIKLSGDFDVHQFSVIIGGHSDDLTYKDEWMRFPQITSDQTFVGNEGVLASAFGGLIYVQDIKITNVRKQIESIQAQVTGAITTPSFVLGETSVEEWGKIRNISAPWAEFVSSGLTLTIPGEKAKDLDNPVELMTYWRDAINSVSDLLGVPAYMNVNRMVFDVQTEVGEFHSGCPIVGPMGAEITALSLRELKHDAFATTTLWHELGHRQQRWYDFSWTWEGQMEVTNMLFAMYVSNVINGSPMDKSLGLLQTFKPETRKSLIKEYIASGLDYKGKVICYFCHHMGILVHYQLQKTFGWDAYKKVFLAYKAMPDGTRPKTHGEKLDTWIITFSKAVNKNLSDFYRSWNFPFSPKVEEQTKNFPASELSMMDLLDDD